MIKKPNIDKKNILTIITEWYNMYKILEACLHINNFHQLLKCCDIKQFIVGNYYL